MEVKKQKKSYASLSGINKPITTSGKIWMGSYITVILCALACYFLLKLQIFRVPDNYEAFLQKLSLGVTWACVILVGIKFTERIIARRSRSRVMQYNLIKLLRLAGYVLVVIVIISFLFQNWYTAVVSLGLISLILGFALQTPITSFIGWLYILVRSPYRIGDRIKIANFTGDVIEVNYLDTTIWEIKGDYLSNEIPSGGLIRFPNNLVLQSPVFNYSWKNFPYMWNEISFILPATNRIDELEKKIIDIVKKEIGENVIEAVKNFKKIVQATAIDEEDIKEEPFVILRLRDDKIQATVNYLTLPREAAALRDNIVKSITTSLLIKEV